MPITEKERRMMAKLVQDQKFVDKDFPSMEKTWKRPHELVDKPELFVDGPSHMDVKQDNLGDCWFLAAATVVAQHPHLLHQVMPENQSLYGNDYQGILVFRFWKLGQWKTVYIDDTLAVDEKNELFFGKCTDINEFWLPLLEKAFAKFHGGYDYIQGGLASEAFLCLTGYIVEDILKTKLNERQLYNMFAMEVQHNSLIAAGAPTGSKEQGIQGAHAYSVTGAYSVRAGDNIVRLVRVRNPWGDLEGTLEWKGAFCDNDPKWTGVDPETRKKLEFLKDEDGQFFMKVSHFKRHFPHLWVASRLPNFGDFYETVSQQIYNISGVWDEGIIVEGNGLEYAENFLRSPQYVLTVEETDNQENGNSDEEDDFNPVFDILIQLVQDQNRAKYSTQLYAIGLSVFQTGDRYPNYLDAENFEEFEPHEGSVEPMEYGSIIARLRLHPGKYIIIPCVQRTMDSRPFLMRVYSRKPITIEAVKQEE